MEAKIKVSKLSGH